MTIVSGHDLKPHTTASTWLTRVSVTAALLALAGLVLYIIAVNVIQRAALLDLQDDLRDARIQNERLVDQLNLAPCPEGFARTVAFLPAAPDLDSPTTLTQASICLPIEGLDR